MPCWNSILTLILTVLSAAYHGIDFFGLHKSSMLVSSRDNRMESKRSLVTKSRFQVAQHGTAIHLMFGLFFGQEKRLMCGRDLFGPI